MVDIGEARARDPRRASAGLLAALALGAGSVIGCNDVSLFAVMRGDTPSANQEVDDQVRAAWRTFAPAATDDDVKAAFADINDVVSKAGTLPLQLETGSLTASDLAEIGVSADPTLAQGVLLVTELKCPLSGIEKILVARNQDALYPGSFEAFTRTYSNDVNAFLGGTQESVDWIETDTANSGGILLGVTETGGARLVPGAGPGGAPVLLARAYQNGPAKILQGGSGAAFEQHYTVEAYIPRDAQTTLHLWAQWSQFESSFLSSNSSLFIQLELGGMSDSDVHTASICQSGTPQPDFE